VALSPLSILVAVLVGAEVAGVLGALAAMRADTATVRNALEAAGVNT